MIISMDMVSSRGLMDVDMLAIGPRVDNMALVSIANHLITKLNMAFGKMEKLSNGSMNNKKFK